MDFFEVVERRHSIRNFLKDKTISEIELQKILATAIKAPSAGNLQSWEFIIIRKEAIKKALVKAALGQSFIAKAPVVVVVCANQLRSAAVYRNRGRDLYSIQDTAAAIQTMLLTITALGFGACWVGAFSESAVREILHIPDGVRPVAIIPIGVPKSIPKPTPRMPLEELIHLETW
ncbi:MAG: nitroreductase family protein [Candidatus Helarchaeota archaeon]